MAHNVTFSIPERKLGKADIYFEVKKDDEALGRLKISKGTIVWLPKGVVYGYKLNWTDFSQIMKDNGKKEGRL